MLENFKGREELSEPHRLVGLASSIRPQADCSGIFRLYFPIR
jgi:hypothetical protein